jgi:hypothetical protein
MRYRSAHISPRAAMLARLGASRGLVDIFVAAADVVLIDSEQLAVVLVWVSPVLSSELFISSWGRHIRRHWSQVPGA